MPIALWSDQENAAAMKVEDDSYSECIPSPEILSITDCTGDAVIHIPDSPTSMQTARPLRSRLFSDEQTGFLECFFKRSKKATNHEMEQLGVKLNMTFGQVKNWFANRRSRERRALNLQLLGRPTVKVTNSDGKVKKVAKSSVATSRSASAVRCLPNSPLTDSAQGNVPEWTESVIDSFSIDFFDTIPADRTPSVVSEDITFIKTVPAVKAIRLPDFSPQDVDTAVATFCRLGLNELLASTRILRDADEVLWDALSECGLAGYSASGMPRMSTEYAELRWDDCLQGDILSAFAELDV